MDEIHTMYVKLSLCSKLILMITNKRLYFNVLCIIDFLLITLFSNYLSLVSIEQPDVEGHKRNDYHPL